MAAMNEEAEKRNTDCVYFLASPLTCKNGNECEYRHSESARINPRDCWFWLSGTCLNSNCPFRHPPLEGRPAAPSATAATAATAAPPAKSRVPCFFFAQGYCGKGDKCSFMHGLVPPLPTEAVASQKLSKPISVKGTETNDKQVAASKGYSSTMSKPSTDSMQVTTEIMPLLGKVPLSNVKAETAARDPVLKVNDVGTKMMPEGSASSGPARPGNHQAASGDRSRQAPLVDDRLHADGNSLLLPLGEEIVHVVHPGDDGPHMGQSVDDRLNEVHSGDDRIQNGKESEEWWEESSSGFDVLVDDGPDQLIYAEDIEYLSHPDVVMESGGHHLRGRLMGADDLADFEYDHSGIYDQSGYYDTAVQYELATYDPYEEELGYDHLESYDHITRQTDVLYRDRQIEGMFLQDRHGLVLEGEVRRRGNSGDLRNHIVKRRRAERNKQSGTDHYQRRRQDSLGKDFQRSRSQQDDHPKQHDRMVRHLVSAHPGTRSNRRLHEQSESLGNKRAYHHIGSGYGGISPEKSFNKKSRNLGEHLKAKGRQKERGWLAAEASEVSETRGHVMPNNKKAESKKDESSFAGPKSLAQIKAEKMKAGGEESLRQRDASEDLQPVAFSHMNKTTKRQVLPIKSQISPAPAETVYNEVSLFEDKKNNHGKATTQEALKTRDFEGPKPLSEILKAKRKGDADIELKSEEGRKEQAQKQSDGAAVNANLLASSKISCVSPATTKDTEHSELPEVSNPGLLARFYNVHRREMKHMERSQVDSNSDMVRKDLRGNAHIALVCLKSTGDHTEEAQQRTVGEEVVHGSDPADDMEYGLEAANNVIEDVDFDDEEDDDFAKKLGGFYA